MGIMLLVVIITAIAVPIIFIALNAGKKEVAGTEIANLNLPERLPPAEEEEWKNREVDPEQFFIKLNTELTMKEDDPKANLALMNPPYSAYDFRVEITLDYDILLYRSEIIKPETFFPEVVFEKKLKAGQYEAVVKYIFYGETEAVVLGEHMVPITILVGRIDE